MSGFGQPFDPMGQPSDGLAAFGLGVGPTLLPNQGPADQQQQAFMMQAHQAVMPQQLQQPVLQPPQQHQHQQQQHPPRGPPLGADLHRLKICGVPAGSFTDSKLRQLFELCGRVVEARIVYDRDSGQAAGYAYVSYATKAEADLAIATFDGQVQLQPGGDLMSVYYAKRQQDSAASGARDGPARNAKLYFTGVPAGVSRETILKLFSQHGRVRHLQLYADELGALSSGTVTMFSRSEAVAAMLALDGAALMPAVAPLKVAWAQLNVAPKAQQAEVPGATVAYCSVPPAVTPHEIAALFQRFGPVLKVIPFPARREGPPGTRGCGRVIVAHPAHAEAAVAALSGKFVWPGAEWPFQVQPYNPPAAGGGGRPGNSNGSSSSAQLMASHGAAAAAAAAANNPLGGLDGLVHGGLAAPSAPPPGCDADAYPLALTNLPPLVDATELRDLLGSYGRVAHLELSPSPRAGGAGAPLGASAGVWYVSRAEADAAAVALHGALLRSAGEEPRRLQVTAGRSGAAGAGMPPSSTASGLGGRVGLLQQQQQQQQRGLSAAWGGLDASSGLQPLGQGYLQPLLGAGGMGGQAADAPWQLPGAGPLQSQWAQPTAGVASVSSGFGAWSPLHQSQENATPLGSFGLGQALQSPLLGSLAQPPQQQQQQQQQQPGFGGIGGFSLPGAPSPADAATGSDSGASTSAAAAAPGRVLLGAGPAAALGGAMVGPAGSMPLCTAAAPADKTPGGSVAAALGQLKPGGGGGGGSGPGSARSSPRAAGVDPSASATPRLPRNASRG